MVALATVNDPPNVVALFSDTIKALEIVVIPETLMLHLLLLISSEIVIIITML